MREAALKLLAANRPIIEADLPEWVFRNAEDLIGVGIDAAKLSDALVQVGTSYWVTIAGASAAAAVLRRQADAIELSAELAAIPHNSAAKH